MTRRPRLDPFYDCGHPGGVVEVDDCTCGAGGAILASHESWRGIMPCDCCPENRMTPPTETIFAVARLPRAELITRFLALHPTRAGQAGLAARMSGDALAAYIWEHTHPTQENPA